MFRENVTLESEDAANHAGLWAHSVDHLGCEHFCDFRDLNSALTFSPNQEWLQMADSGCDGCFMYLVSMLFLMFGFPVEPCQNFHFCFHVCLWT